MNHPEIGAVICTYNRYDVLPGAIDSLLHQDMGEALDILVIDNSPDQEKAAQFGAAYDDTPVRYLLEPVPGLSNARNVGAEACNAKYVAYMDDDAVAAPDWARNLMAGLETMGPEAAVAGGRIIPRWLTPRPDWLPDELIGNLSIVDWGGATRFIGKSEWLAGCNIAFDRQMLLDVGGFSRALGRIGAGLALLSNEESAVIDKFAEIHRRAIYVPNATVEHLIEPARLNQEWFRRRAAWQAVSDYIKDPQRAQAYAGAAAERVRREMLSDDNSLPPGFVRSNCEREQFRHDVGLMYDVVIAMLAGGVELGGATTSLRDKLIASVRHEMQRHPHLRSAIRKLANR
jgi:glycosyltransferase involved in cell wall biosynthesis